MIDLHHIAFSFVHGGFDPDNKGGCSCETCRQLREDIREIRSKEAEQYLEELRYGRGR